MSDNSDTEEQPQHETRTSRWRRLWKRVSTLMHSKPGTGEERLRHESTTSTGRGLWKRVWSLVHPRSQRADEERPHHESTTSPHHTPIDTIQTSTFDPYPQSPRQEQGKEEKSEPGDQPQDGPSISGFAQEQGREEESDTWDQPQGLPYLSSGQEQEEGPDPGEQPQNLVSSAVYMNGIEDPHPKYTNKDQGSEEMPSPWDLPRGVPSLPYAINTSENEYVVITSIRAADVAVGLRRLPAGFYIVVCHSGLEWRTENKSLLVNDDVIEWKGSIPIPSDPSATVHIGVYASFEFQPILGAGEQLRKLSISVEQLFDHNARDVPFLFPEDGDVVFSCPTILVTIQQGRCESNDPSTFRIFDIHGSTMEFRGELEDETDRGHSALVRYQEHGEIQDLERSIEHFERAFNMCPLDHSCRAAAQSNLAMARLVLCHVKDTDASLDVPLGLYHDALAARYVGHFDRPSTLIHLATVHLTRFEERRDEVEAARAEALLREAIELSSADSHENRAATFLFQLLAGRRMGLVQAGGRLSVEQGAMSCLTNEDLWILSVQLLLRFERFGDLDNLQQAIALLEELVRSTPMLDDQYHTRLANLGVALSYRFDHVGELADLERAISRKRDAAELLPFGHPDKPSYLSNLATSFISRFQRLGQSDDIEDAISTLKGAVELTPREHPQKPSYLVNFGNSLIARFQNLGELTDLENAISRYMDAIDITTDGDPNKPNRLNNLGNSFVARFERLGELSDLERAISTLRDAVDLTPDGHPYKSGHLNTLGNSMRARFVHFGELRDLQDAISMLRSAIDLAPHGHPEIPVYLTNLGTCLCARFQRLGELNDLEHAISVLGDAVDLTPHGHPDKPSRLNNLGSTFVIRFDRLGELNDLEDAISKLKEAVDLTPRGHPNRSNHLSSLGNSLVNRFERIGELSDLEDAISTLTDAADLPSGHRRDKPGHLNDLGHSLIARFERLGELSDLEQAVFRNREALDLTPHDHPDRPSHLSSLSNSLMTRFWRLQEPSDLEDAISMLRDAVDLTPDGYPDKSAYLNSLGNALSTRFERVWELTDLEDAISRYSDAVNLTPSGHPHKPKYLNNLGTSFRARSEHLEGQSDLEHSILTLKDAVQLTPRGDLHKHAYLYNLGDSFLERFKRFGELSDLEDAISRYKDAVDLTPHGHPYRPSHLNSLGNSLVSRFERLGEHSDLEQAISVYSRAASVSIGPIRDRFHASQQWISCALRTRHHTLLRAYSIAISLLPQLAWIGLSLTHRYSELRRGSDIVREAAAAALDSGLPETAVEWLEHGRSIVWGELFQLRSSYAELSSAHPHHAHRLRELSAALEHAGIVRERSQSAEHHAMGSLQQEADKHRALAIERDKLLQEIRSLPGFERFLLHKEFSQLRASTHSGPAVILNAAKTRCDALIVLPGVDHVIHIPLFDFPFKRFTGLLNIMNSLLRHARVIRLDEREGNPEAVAWEGANWESLLSPLWKCVVKPVLDALAFSTPGDPSRIFWCPTGPFTFLPIHAAGFYDTQCMPPGHKVFDFVVSSYIPALSILTLSPNPSAPPRTDVCLLAVRQPPSDGLPQLPGVDIELRHIKEVIRNSSSAETIFLESSIGTVEEVLALMKDADWVHFACHGNQDAANPTSSGLCLADRRRLKISDIIALSRSRGGLAFLSACQTATGDKELSDEAIHIAAGMLFAGYGGVIGTMWSIRDSLAPRVARNVYGRLFRDGTRVDYREAAQALHEAIGRLRDSGTASFVEWLPFVHVGL